jgi:hypothetical protein
MYPGCTSRMCTWIYPGCSTDVHPGMCTWMYPGCSTDVVPEENQDISVLNKKSKQYILYEKLYHTATRYVRDS